MTLASAPGDAILETQALTARYGHVRVLAPTDIRVRTGELVAILGPNGAGKSTLLRAILGLTSTTGQVMFQGKPLPRGDAVAVSARGVVLVPEGRGIFGPMTVEENLQLGAYRLGRDKPEFERRLARVLELFPRLGERRAQLGGSMSGGEQQMLAIGRALMGDPKILLLDEPSLGLAPRITAEIFEKLATLRDEGLPILLVEQKAPAALKMATRVYVLSLGRIAASLDADQITSHEDLAQYYFT